jgi:hypothetical protein
MWIPKRSSHHCGVGLLILVIVKRDMTAGVCQYKNGETGLSDQSSCKQSERGYPNDRCKPIP